MKWVYLLVLLVLSTYVVAQSPVKATFAYSRTTVPGIPPANRGAAAAQTPFPATYLIYIVVKKGAELFVAAVCVQGKRYPGTLTRVESPVVVEHDLSVRTGRKDVLVPETTDDVYQVELQQTAGQPCDLQTPDKLAEKHGVVLRLKAGQSTWYALSEKIVPLAPAAAM